ncbi:hypothetical protein V8E36_007253, partial [Tilletia maclaganii]
PPSNLAPGVPVVPLWVSLLPLLRSMLGQPPLGQDLHFERYIAPRLAKCGCVVIFFGGRWSLLFSHPAGIQANHFDRRQVASFRQLCLRRPPTLSTRPAITSRFLMRVISQRGHVFRRVLAAELIQTGSSADAARACSDAAAALVTHLRTTVSASKADEPGAFNDAFQRFSMQSLFFAASPPKVHRLHAAVKRHIFDPFFLTFPALDQWPWTYLFPSRDNARQLIRALEQEIVRTL